MCKKDRILQLLAWTKNDKPKPFNHPQAYGKTARHHSRQRERPAVGIKEEKSGGSVTVCGNRCGAVWSRAGHWLP